MNYSEQLTTNYSRNIAGLVFRIFVILCTAFIPGGLINEDMDLSIVDCMRQILGTYLMITQFDLMIPEIDSFKEEIRMIAKDRKIAVYYLLFNILKLNYDTWICRVMGWYVGNESNLSSPIHDIFNLYRKPNSMKLKGEEKSEVSIPTWYSFQNPVVREDCLLIAVSILAIYSARTYKFNIKISIRKTILKINGYVLKSLKVFMTIFLCYLSFFSKDEIICLIFLSVLIYHMLKLMRKANNSKRNIKMTGYVNALKHTSLLVIMITELLKSINEKYLASIKIDSKIDDGFFKICRQIKEGYVGDFTAMLIIVLLFLYLKRVKLGARLDFFDVHLNENMKKLYLY